MQNELAILPRDMTRLSSCAALILDVIRPTITSRLDHARDGARVAVT